MKNLQLIKNYLEETKAYAEEAVDSFDETRQQFIKGKIAAYDDILDLINSLERK